MKPHGGGLTSGQVVGLVASGGLNYSIVTLGDLAGWAWENQGGATLTQEARGVLFTIPGSASDNIRQLYLAPPSTDYQLTVRYNMETFPQSQFKFGGIGHKDALGAAGKLDLWNFDGRGDVQLINAQYSDQTTFASQTAGTTNLFAHDIWLRMKVQGGSIYYYYSRGGEMWTLQRSYALVAGYLGAAGYNYLLIEGNESCASSEGIGIEILSYDLVTL